MLVGDMIVRMRELGPDPAPALGVPSTPFSGGVQVAGGLLGLGTYFWVMTQLTPWGESLAGTEGSVVLAGANNAIQITATLHPAATAVRLYIGILSGAEQQYQQVAVTPLLLTQNLIVFNGANLLPGTPPTRSRAYMPDSDGAFVGAQTAYAWLGEALLALSKASQGVYDFTGMSSANGQPLYTLNGIWEDLDHAWYDGWIMDLGNKAQIYYRNRIATSIAGLMVFQKVADTMIVELFPQPNRNANTTTTTGAITAASSTIPLTTSNFVLPMGLALLGTGPTAEIVAYAFNSGAQLTGVIRGCGGTVAQAWATGTVVTELNIRVSGRRIVTPYAVGSSASFIPAPPEWATWIPMYMLSRYRDAEGEHKLATEMRQEFMNFVNQLGKGNKQRGGPRQIGAGPQVGEVYGGTLGGGWLLP